MTGHPASPGGLFCAIGSPLNDGTWQYSWVNGRQLARMQSVDTDASFVYNENFQETYNITDDHAQTMRTEFLHYFTFGAPALYLIHFYTVEGEIYSYHFDGEYGAILYSSYAPYGVG